jgi:heptosyltransferase-2
MSTGRILVVAPAWVGDMVMAESAIHRLAELHPGEGIDVLAPGATAPLGERMAGVTRVWTLPAEHGRLGLGARWRMARQLRGERYHLAVVLPGSWKSALIPFLAGIPRRRGYRREFRYGLLNDLRAMAPKRSTRTVDDYVALAEDHPGARPVVRPPKLRTDSAAAREVATRLGAGLSGKPILALCPGAEFGPAKRWPTRHFAALAAMAVARGDEVWLIGSPKEKELGEEIVAAAHSAEPPSATGALPPPGVLPGSPDRTPGSTRGPLADADSRSEVEWVPAKGRDAATGRLEKGRILDLIGRTSLLEAVDLLSLADEVVSNDSGLMHVAGALGRKLVAIYGSTSPSVTPPLGANAVIAEIALGCRPCFQRTCPLGHTNCLNLLTPEMVDNLLASPAGTTHGFQRTTWDGAPVAKESPFGATVVVIRRKGQLIEFLVLHRARRRAEDHGDWEWTPPSGARLPTESIEACAKRELKEETGLELPAERTELASEKWAVFSSEAGPDDQVRLSSEHDRYEWVSGEEAIVRCRPEAVAAQIRLVWDRAVNARS